MRVKIFDVFKAIDLEDKINSFLDGKDHIEVIDIKFNSYSFGEENTDCHSAMIIYKYK